MPFVEACHIILRIIRFLHAFISFLVCKNSTIIFLLTNRQCFDIIIKMQIEINNSKGIVMKTFFGSLYHAFAMANPEHIIWCAAVLLTMLVLAVLHHRWRDDVKMIKLWKWLCLIPFLTVIAHFLIYAASYPLLSSAFFPLYFIGLFALIPIPFANRKIGYPITASLVGILSVVCGLYFSAQSPNIKNFVKMSYTTSFHALVREMDKKYVLKEWKEIDFAALEEKYMPMVKTAEEENDPAKFADAITMFCNELHDGHVWADVDLEYDKYSSVIRQHEYGLAMVKLDNGDVIAVCTVDEVHSLGIEDGTVITKWNGKPVVQAAEEDVPEMGYPVKSNEDRIAVMQLSGIGGETVEVSFIDGSGKEQTVTLSDLGEVHTLREAVTAFSRQPDHTNESEMQAFFDANFSAKMLNDKCGYLVLNAEGTGNDWHDILGYLTGDHRWAREMFREKLRGLKAQGMEYLVIDLRCNMGGLDEIGCALADLLTEEEYYGQGLGIRKNGQYTCVSDHGICGDGEFADLQAVAITNYMCASAGDGTALYLSRLSNITLAGITDPNGCNQETGGSCVLSDGIVIVGYPIGLVLNEDGVPNIDTRADRISRNPVEVRIPFDYDAAMRIFRDKEDYELDWAIQYLERNAEKP